MIESAHAALITVDHRGSTDLFSASMCECVPAPGNASGQSRCLQLPRVPKIWRVIALHRQNDWNDWNDWLIGWWAAVSFLILVLFCAILCYEYIQLNIFQPECPASVLVRVIFQRKPFVRSPRPGGRSIRLSMSTYLNISQHHRLQTFWLQPQNHHQWLDFIKGLT